MNKAIIYLVILLGVIACNHNHKEDQYTNKGSYKISTNESVELYYSTNSCCYYCVSNKSELKYTQLVEDKMIDKGPSDCEGCNYISAFVFKGKSKGIDTVELKIVQANMDCYSNDVQPERYIIEVK